jgi:hypothetical protein
MRYVFLAVLSFLFIFSSARGQEIPADLKNRPACLPFYSIKKTWRPALFQGHSKKKNYFEGWYFKMASADTSTVLAVIPGISLSRAKEKSHAFVQVIHGQTGNTSYIEYPLEAFQFSNDSFLVRVGPNVFSRYGARLDIQGPALSLQGDVCFSNPRPYPVKMFRPGIMGWYRFVPFMECYHGVVSLGHGIKGQLEWNGSVIDFNGGKGYIEKDWGKSMPSSWVWAHSNHFQDTSVSLMVSIAEIPWLGSSFTGFLAVLSHGDQVYTFTTYTKARITDHHIHDKGVKILIEDKHYRLKIKASRSQTGHLKAPVSGAMDRRIAESLDAEIAVSLSRQEGGLVFGGTGKNAGLEMVGNVRKLFSNDPDQ